MAVSSYYSCQLVFFGQFNTWIWWGNFRMRLNFLEAKLNLFQFQPAQREVEHGNSLLGGSNDGSTTSEMTQLLDLNVPVALVEDFGKPGNGIG
jgi:hypothetical protein